MESENIPPKTFLILKLISIFGYVYSIYSIGLGLFVLYFLGFSGNLLEVSIMLSFAIFTIFPGIFLIFSSRGLWKLKNWARIGILVISVFSFFSTFVLQLILTNFVFIIPGILDIFLMFLWGGIFFYLLLNKNIKKVFL